jgi:RHS repeat-associated protein
MEDTSLVEITSSYVYNQSGIRVRSNTSTKIDNATPTVKNRKYLLDSGMTGYSQVLEELDAVNNTLVKSYTLGDDVLSQSAVVSGQSAVSYLLYDGHGSTRLLTSASSAVSARYNYDAYGKNLFSANVTNPSATDMLYSGEQFDTNLQMQYLRARYYDQNNGTFNRFDPFNGNMGDPQSLHKYAYCHGDPIGGIDPSGMMTLQSLLYGIAIVSILQVVSASAMTLAGVNSNISWLPDAAFIGVSGSTAKIFKCLSKLASYFPGELGEKLIVLGKILLQVATGLATVEILFSIASSQIAVFWSLGGGIGLHGAGRGAGDSISAYSGVIWNLRNASQYKKASYGFNIYAGMYGGSGFTGGSSQGQHGRFGGISFGKSLLPSKDVGFGFYGSYAVNIFTLNPPMWSMPLASAGWALGSLLLVGNGALKKPGSLFSLTTIASTWPYAKWSNSDTLKRRRKERY